VRAAQAQPQFRASVNNGAPPIAATSRPSAFHAAAGVTATRSAAGYTPPVRQGPAPASLPGGATNPAAGHFGGTPGPAPAVIAARPSGFAGQAQASRPAAFGAPAAVVRAPAPAPAASVFHAPAPVRIAPQIQAPPQRAAPMAVAHAAAPPPARPAQSGAPGRP
jgi:hypothetical protein